MYLYHIISGIKFILGVAIILIVYTSINIYEDPMMGIGLGFLGIFIASWGISFYLFVGIQNIYRHVEKLRIIKDSYKLSLLFGIYVLINILLLLLEYRNKYIGIVLLIGFVFLQIALFSDSAKKNEEDAG
ncbi:MAG: hypothetical protein CO170_03855 [candidate division SR1 bacterium CG_4_9_14_3_um_filter_40_9]|nr:MAG: hypothetical protein CO170_03855 [candidate division SR1 bacterium CG_4_9_14_3_um_filter_40_9]